MERSAPLGSVQVPAVNPPAPRVIRFSDGAYCAVADRASLDRLLAAAGRMPPTQWEGTPRALLVVLLVLLVSLLIAVMYGIPYLASRAVEWIPAPVTAQVSEHTLAVLDRDVLGPTALPRQQRDQLEEAFFRMVGPERRAAYRLEFRSGEQFGANAAALPSGIIVVTDDLVRLARDHREILGVLAHEAGHVERRHGLRLLAQNSLLGLAAAWLAGDMSTILAAAPSTLLQAKYSRDFERDADAYAAELLRANGIPPSMLADLLERLAATERERTGVSQGGIVLDYLSSHPATEERLRYLRGEG